MIHLLIVGRDHGNRKGSPISRRLGCLFRSGGDNPCSHIQEAITIPKIERIESFRHGQRFPPDAEEILAQRKVRMGQQDVGHIAHHSYGHGFKVSEKQEFWKTGPPNQAPPFNPGAKR